MLEREDLFLRFLQSAGREGTYESRHRSEMTAEKAKCLQRSHVIEGMVQLLTNGFVLQLLSIQLVWRADVNSKYSRWQGQSKGRQEFRDRLR